MRKWRSLARIIALSDDGCFVVFPSYNWKIAVYVPSLPTELIEAGKFAHELLPYRTYAMIAYKDPDSPFYELDPEWCK